MSLSGFTIRSPIFTPPLISAEQPGAEGYYCNFVTVLFLVNTDCIFLFLILQIVATYFIYGTVNMLQELIGLFIAGSQAHWQTSEFVGGLQHVQLSYLGVEWPSAPALH